VCNLRRRLLRAAYGEQRFCTHRRTAIVALLSTPAPEDVSQEGGSPPRVARTGHGQPPAAYDLLPLRYCWFLTRADYDGVQGVVRRARALRKVNPRGKGKTHPQGWRNRTKTARRRRPLVATARREADNARRRLLRAEIAAESAAAAARRDAENARRRRLRAEIAAESAAAAARRDAKNARRRLLRAEIAAEIAAAGARRDAKNARRRKWQREKNCGSLSEAARAAEVVLPVVPINLVEVYEVGASHRYIYIHHIFIYTTYHLMFAD
jgi:hypothetical protein